MKSSVYNALMVLFVTFVVAGTGTLVWLWAAPQWDAYQAETQMVSVTTSSMGSSSSSEGSQSLSEAHSYNQSLAGESSSSTTAYPNQLAGLAGEAISWLHIPSINVRRPVFHYDNEQVLMAGLGHIEGTSLPVGGESTHCCVTGHSGMIGSRMFDDLGNLRIGDVFVFWTLGDPYAYKVYDIEIVEPDDTSSLQIQPGRDLATLITCTPYGINSHRLLVHGERTEYIPEETTLTQHPVSDRLWVLAAGVGAAAIGLGLLLYLVLGTRTLRLSAVTGATGGDVWTRGHAGHDERSHMTFKIKAFGRADIDIGGASFKGRWHRDGRDYVVDLPSQAEGLISSDSGVMTDIKLPDHVRITREEGRWVADATVDGESSILTFER